MRPPNLKTRIFLDSGDPQETRDVRALLGFLDGQTTNPSLISKNPAVQERFTKGKKWTEEEVYAVYKKIVREVASLVEESVSIEVYADAHTTAEQMIAQARDFNTWIDNAYIKLPTTKEGLRAAHTLSAEGMRLNMTLVFSQQQAAAVYAATRGAQKGSVYLSPFIGRLDDRGQNGMHVIANILKMYATGDGHVAVLTASVRSTDHLMAALQLGADCITAPAKILRAWAAANMPIPDASFQYQPALDTIAYETLDLTAPWTEFDIAHELTDAGVAQFSHDWNALIT